VRSFINYSHLSQTLSTGATPKAYTVAEGGDVFQQLWA